MREVTEQERWDYVKDKEVTFHVSERYPYDGFWKDKNSNVIAKDIVQYDENDKVIGKKYFIKE